MKRTLLLLSLFLTAGIIVLGVGYAKPACAGDLAAELSAKGIPAYPGAVLVSQMKKGAMPTNSALFATSDPKSKVVAFYKEKLTGWKSDEEYGTYAFWKGSKTFDFASDYMKPIDVVAIMELGKSIPGVPDDAKTKIQIGYR